MEYNTQRPILQISEYGRNVQKMIQFACTVEDRKERTRIAESIISIMAQMNPQIKELSDYEQKLWSHMFIISDFELDVDSPFPKPQKNQLLEKPDRVPYPKRNIKYKHYGNSIHLFIEKAKSMEDGPEKKAFIECIANMMKKAYLNWNRDSVNDSVIIKHLHEISNGELTLDENFVLDETSDILAKNNNNTKRRKKYSSNNKHKNRKNNRS